MEIKLSFKKIIIINKKIRTRRSNLIKSFLKNKQKKLSFKGGFKMAAFSKVEKVLITSYFNQRRNYIRKKNQICIIISVHHECKDICPLFGTGKL